MSENNYHPQEKNYRNEICPTGESTSADELKSQLEVLLGKGGNGKSSEMLPLSLEITGKMNKEDLRESLEDSRDYKDILGK